VKLGAENKKQIIVMVVLLGILLTIGIYDVISSSDTSAAPPPAATTTTTTASAATKPAIAGKKGFAPSGPNTLDPTLHLNVLEASRRVKYEPGRNIFRMEEAPIPTPNNVRVKETPTPIPTPTPTPPPPPIPLKFYGFQNRSATDKQIFLAENDVVFVAKQGDIIDRRYRVVSIQKTSVTIEDVLTNNKQDIPLRNQQ
jgi:hypothetical protein